MKKQLSAFVIVISFLLSACGAAVSAQPTATVTSAPPTDTFTPTQTSTPEPTFTPTATPTPRLPVALGTQVPVSDKVITTDNIDQVVELARWGKGVITDAVFSPDEKLIAVATTLGVSLYEVTTLNEILYFETDASVNSLVFSPEGDTIATGLSDNTLKLWNTADGTLIRSLDAHVNEKDNKDAGKAEVTSVAFSPDGNHLAGGSSDGTVCLWQVPDGGLVRTLENHKEEITSVFYSPDSAVIFSASRDGKVQMVNTADGRLVRTFLGTSIIDASLSNDGKTLATYDTYYYYNNGVNDIEEKLILWDVETGQELENILNQGFIWNHTTDLTFSPNSQFIAAALEDRSIKIWDVAAGELQNTFADLIPKTWYYLDDFTLAFSPDSQFLLLAGSNVIGVWDMQKKALLNSAIMKSEEMIDIVLSPDGKMLAAIEGPNVDLIEVADGKLLPMQKKIQSSGSLDFSLDGTDLLMSQFDPAAQLWPIANPGKGRKLGADDFNQIGGVAFSPDGGTVGLGTRATGEVELVQVSDGTLLKTMFIDRYAFVQSVRFSPDGRYLAASTWDRIRLFELPDGQLLQTYNRGPSIAFSPDSTLFVGGSSDKTITVWKMPKGDILYTIKDRPDEIRALTFSPNGEYLAAGYFDGTIEILRSSDGGLLRRWKAHSRGITDLIFTADGKLLISSSWDATIRMWGIMP